MTKKNPDFLLNALQFRLMGIAAHLKENSKSVVESEVEFKKPLIDMIDSVIDVNK